MVSSVKSLDGSFIPMRVLLGVVQLSPLMGIISVIDFGSYPNAPKFESFASVLEGSLVKWFTDSQSAAKIGKREV